MRNLATEVIEQLTARDAAVLTWLGIALCVIGWSALRGGDVGRSVTDVVIQFGNPRIAGLVLLAGAWQLGVVWAAAQVGLWDESILKDTVVIVTAGGFAAGFKAVAITQGKRSWRSEVRSLLTVVVALQWLSNVETFPYVVELILLPVAVILGGMQAIASHRDEYAAARSLINGLIATFGVVVISWSALVVISSWASRQFTEDALGFALAFWLPIALLPIVYLEALMMEYGRTFSVMKVFGQLSVSARVEFVAHHGLNLSRLLRFTRRRGAIHDFARATSREERRNLLRLEAPCSSMDASHPAP